MKRAMLRAMTAVFFMVSAFLAVSSLPAQAYDAPKKKYDFPTTENSLRAKGAKRLSAGEIKKLVNGKTAYSLIVGGQHDGKKRNHKFDKDGRFYTWNVWDNRGDGSKWYVTKDGRLCRRYYNWFNANIICRKVYKYYERYYWIDSGGRVKSVILSLR